MRKGPPCIVYRDVPRSKRRLGRSLSPPFFRPAPDLKTPPTPCTAAPRPVAASSARRGSATSLENLCPVGPWPGGVHVPRKRAGFLKALRDSARKRGKPRAPLGSLPTPLRSTNRRRTVRSRSRGGRLADRHPVAGCAASRGFHPLPRWLTLWDHRTERVLHDPIALVGRVHLRGLDSLLQVPFDQEQVLLV